MKDAIRVKERERKKKDERNEGCRVQKTKRVKKARKEITNVRKKKSGEVVYELKIKIKRKRKGRFSMQMRDKQNERIRERRKTRAINLKGVIYEEIKRQERGVGGGYCVKKGEKQVMRKGRVIKLENII